MSYYFSDNVSAADIIGQHGSHLNEFIYQITSVCIDVCPPIIFVEKSLPKKKKQLDSFTFSSFLLYIEAQRTRFEESSVSGIKRLISNAAHSAQSLLTMHIIG